MTHSGQVNIHLGKASNKSNILINYCRKTIETFENRKQKMANLLMFFKAILHFLLPEILISNEHEICELRFWLLLRQPIYKNLFLVACGLNFTLNSLIIIFEPYVWPSVGYFFQR